MFVVDIRAFDGRVKDRQAFAELSNAFDTLAQIVRALPPKTHITMESGAEPLLVTGIINNAVIIEIRLNKEQE